MEEYEKIELRSEEIQEILGTPPRAIVRWGTTVAFLTFCVLIFISYFIRYPDIIKGTIVLTTANPPIEITSPVDASNLILFIVNGQPVINGDILGQMDALANYNDIFFLEQQLKGELSIVDQNSLRNFNPNPDLKLGVIQSLYTRFIKNLESFRFDINSNYSQLNIQSLNNQINSLQNAIKANNERIPNLELELKTAEVAVEQLQKKYVNDTSLFGQLQTAIQNKNRLKTEFKNLDAENAIKLAEISNLQTKIKNSQAESGTSNSYSLNNIKGDISNLISEIDKWKNNYLLVAPKAGTVVLADKIREKQTVQKDEKILSIVPQGGEKNFFGKVELPIKGSGKVIEGQAVVIKFDNFPYKEYGMVKGIVERKSIIPNDEVQNIIVTMDSNLITSQNKKLPYTPFMQGTAEIITSDRRLIERIFENVSAILEDH